MDWSKGFSALYTAHIIDPETWTDGEELRFTDGNIERADNSDLRESAPVTVSEMVGDGEEWIRIYLQATQTGDAVRVPLFTGLTSAPEKKITGNRSEWQMDCFSVLKPPADVLLPRGYYAPAGSSAELAKRLLDITTAPVTTDNGSPTLKEPIVAADGETRLTMAKKILTAIGWRIAIDGTGAVRLCPYENEPVVTFSPMTDDSIEPEVTDTRNWFDCPNVYRAVSETSGTAVARDDDPDSPLSTVARGREIWKEENNVTVPAGETMAAYAVRKLKEEQAVVRKLSYNRRFYSDIGVGDVVELNYPGQGLDGRFRITSQSIDLGYGARTKEEVTEL